MAYLCIVINDTLNSVEQLNAKTVGPANDSLNGDYAVALLKNYLSGCEAGTIAAATLQVTTRTTNPAISTAGSNSTQISYTNFA